MSEVNQTHPGNPVNDPTPKGVRTHSLFPFNRHFYQTDRFGEISPFWAYEAVAGDKRISERAAHSLRTLSLSSPLMSGLQIKKDFFSVPMEAILPLNWDKVFTNPLIGQDVDKNVNCVVEEFPTLLSYYVDTIQSYFSDSSSSAPASETFTYLFRALINLERFYSYGSLFSQLGYHFESCFEFLETYGTETYKRSFDYFFDYCCNSFINDLQDASVKSFYFGENGEGFICNLDDNGTNNLYACSFRRFLELMRQNPSWSISSDLDDFFPDGIDYTLIFSNCSVFLADVPINFARIFAYQIVCAHFYTNDHVDYIFDANLYRQLIQYYIDQASLGVDSFTLNGLTYKYDSLSGFYLESFFNSVIDNGTPFDENFSEYLGSLFGFRQSLRFVDYFTGSKTQPLAVGDTDINVNTRAGGQQYVDVIDVTKNIQAQRFYNAVNRASRKSFEYVEAIFGVKQAYDFHNPAFLAHVADRAGAVETENTGDAQITQPNSVTSNLRSNSSRFMFTFSCDRPSVILGLKYYDMPRAYYRATDRQNFHSDRFEMFNPFMQYTGDQPVYTAELNMKGGTLSPFAYQLRYMEFKQTFDSLAGGFVENLPGWAFKADEYNRGGMPDHIDPDFIRSSNVELDGYFVQLSGYSLGNYFHFIVDNLNSGEAVRPMAYAPSIL